MAHSGRLSITLQVGVFSDGSKSANYAWCTNQNHPFANILGGRGGDGIKCKRRPKMDDAPNR